ncbi:hypothetical protein EYC80_007316 [Monilinia laxa]|uniref:Uncharacterized protein n=1 Tax=Monilinia laxa TaxID=61186 RepID=A0A5N6JUA5_MONLA|nr:hypothetical protein EYC80_007316 [Monilinia laxa]
MSQNENFETWSTMTINGSLLEFDMEWVDVLNGSFEGGEREGLRKKEWGEVGEMWEMESKGSVGGGGEGS